MRFSRLIGRLLALIILACLLFSFAPANSAVGDPPIVSITASPSLIMGCRSFGSSERCSGEREVTLYATVQSPEGDNLVFTWAVTGGRLKGKGRKVKWDISGLGEGTYTAMVDVKYAKDRSVSRSTVIRIFPCVRCDPPPCPSLSVSCPSSAESKHEIEFVATVSGGDATLIPTYKWSVSAGRISSGQRTSKITLNVSALAGKSVTAKIKIGGVAKGCTGTEASCTVLDIR